MAQITLSDNLTVDTLDEVSLEKDETPSLAEMLDNSTALVSTTLVAPSPETGVYSKNDRYILNFDDSDTLYKDPSEDTLETTAYDTVKGDFPGRIDYIYMKANESYHVDASEIIFTPDTLGTISDHYAVVTKFRFGEKLPDVASSSSVSTSTSTPSTLNTSTTSTSTASSSNTSEMSSISTTKSTPYFVEFTLVVHLLMGWRRRVQRNH